MGAPMTPIAPVQVNALPTPRKLELLNEIFEILEYDGHGKPGAVRDSDDALQAIYEAFDRHRVRFTDPNQIPNGYRFNEHTIDPGSGTSAGTGPSIRCRWSGTLTLEPYARRLQGLHTQCPDFCKASTVEVDPDAPGPDDRDDYGDAVRLVAICDTSRRQLILEDGVWKPWPFSGTETVRPETHDGPCVPMAGTIGYSHTWSVDAAAERRLSTWHEDHPTS